MLGLRLVAPSLADGRHQPPGGLLDVARACALFLAVAVLAGGVREELQRAFILHRFDQRLGGIRVGLGLFTLAFAAQHFEQGADVAIAIGLLALWWGAVYARRRSVWLPMANHAGFNGLQVLQAWRPRPWARPRQVARYSSDSMRAPRSLALALLFLLSLPAVTTRIYASDEIQYFAFLRSMLLRSRSVASTTSTATWTRRA